MRALVLFMAAPPDPATASAVNRPQIAIEDRVQPLAGSVQDALREHAAILIPCPKDKIEIREVLLGPPSSPSHTNFVDRCGQRVVYASRAEYQDNPPYPRFYVVSRFPLTIAFARRRRITSRRRA